MLNTYGNTKEPDILEVISDLSNDEVFTPPSLANQMLDLLPPEVWKDSSLRWIDPFTKTGVFLREITKRLLVGLQEEIPNEQQRLEHILRNMVFGVAITELTSLMSRRSLYCSKWADSEKSVVKFSNKQGNLVYQRVEHEFFRGRCSECLAGEAQHGSGPETENYAYALLHQEGRRFIDKEIGLKFDIVVGNPPYQMKGGGGGVNDSAIYHLFVDQALDLNPTYISMIIPSRWMSSGRGLDDFRSKMLSSCNVSDLVDFHSPVDVFPTVSNEGGVCYFLWDRHHKGGCRVTLNKNGEILGPELRDLNQFDVFVRDSRAITILNLVLAKNLAPLSEIASADTPFGFASNFAGFDPVRTSPSQISYHWSKQGQRSIGFIRRDEVKKNSQDIDAHKVLLPLAYGLGGKGAQQVIGRPMVAEPPSVCSQTFRYFGPLETREEAEGLSNYLQLRLPRYLISLRKNSQNTYRETFHWVPVMDWKVKWTDDTLYEFFNLSTDQIQLIESEVRGMSV